MDNKQNPSINPIRLVFKTLILFILINILWAVFEPQLGYYSIYSHLVKGRPRFPFGEVPQLAYNFTLDNLHAMFESHEIDTLPNPNQYTVIVLGDSSVWGTLLLPEDTLSGQLNELGLIEAESHLPIRFYNLGYPTLSLTKDLMILEEALDEYEPDMVIWLVTLESMLWEHQLRSPIVQANPRKIEHLIYRYNISFAKAADQVEPPNFWQRTLVGRRRDIADIIRLQLYGILWEATGIDQYYPDEYTPAARDLDNDTTYYRYTEISFSVDDLAIELLQAGMNLKKHTPMIIVNEPILVSQGDNSDIRYNFYYPRWVYDNYRIIMSQQNALNQWDYIDTWNLIPADEFTNSAIHLTPLGSNLLAEHLADYFINRGIWITKE
jgi:hypothetical protein